MEEKDNKIISRWRNAISVSKNGSSFNMYRFDKSEAKWKKIIFFKSMEDLYDFIAWLDETFPDEDEGEGEGEDGDEEFHGIEDDDD